MKQRSVRTINNKASYRQWTVRKNFMQSLMQIPSSPQAFLPLSEEFDTKLCSDLFLAQIAEVNLGPLQQLRWIKMELFDQVFLCLGILTRRNVELVETKALYTV